MFLVRSHGDDSNLVDLVSNDEVVATGELVVNYPSLNFPDDTEYYLPIMFKGKTPRAAE